MECSTGSCPSSPVHRYSRKRVSEADWESGRLESCEVNGDNLGAKSSGADQDYFAQNLEPAWDSNKRYKRDKKKVQDGVTFKYEGSLANEPDLSSIEATSVLTVGGEAFTHTACLANHVSLDFPLLGDKIVKLDQADHDFTTVQNRFFTGLGMLASYTTIKGIYKNCYRSTSGLSRLQAFKKQEEITKIARGDANIKYAWHSTSKQGVSVIVLHGFGQPRTPKNGAMYGVGVYLAPEDYSHVSAVYSDVDENGEQHIVLCRVIMGNIEQVEQGSQQFHPINEHFDTGVDDICNPKRFVVWTTHMNTHILPEYIISFKLAPPWNDIIAALRVKSTAGKALSAGKVLQFEGKLCDCSPLGKASCDAGKQVRKLPAGCCLDHRVASRTPRSPWMSFPMLFLVMKTSLSDEKMHELQQHYLQFKIGRMPRGELIKVVRSIAGDRLLSDSIRSMQAQEKANVESTVEESQVLDDVTTQN